MQVERTYAQGLCQLPDRQKSDVLQPSFDRTDVGPTHTYANGDCLLAETRCKSVDADVGAEHLAIVHPQDRRQPRIWALRTIRRGQSTGATTSLCFYSDQASMAFTVRLVSKGVDGCDACLTSPLADRLWLCGGWSSGECSSLAAVAEMTTPPFDG